MENVISFMGPPSYNQSQCRSYVNDFPIKKALVKPNSLCVLLIKLYKLWKITG